jgi:hypothetical protein
MRYVSNSLKKIKAVRAAWLKSRRLQNYLKGNRIPWSEGYEDFKWMEIAKAIRSEEILSAFKNKILPSGYGLRMDDRLVEYPYVFARMKKDKSKLLDAGSTFNFETIVEHPLVIKKELSIYTYLPENNNFLERRISYDFGDLRNLPYRDSWFEEVVCISTLEHIGLDNSIYGFREADADTVTGGPDSYLIAIEEMLRVLAPGGQLLMTFPFGQYGNYGFFQQFDASMLSAMRSMLDVQGKTDYTFFQYTLSGWKISDENTCRNCISYNPHTGTGKGDDGAAHSRAICAIQFTKYIK